VAIVGCAACANNSIAYEKNQPVYKFSTDEKTGETRTLPYALLEHAGHLRGMLEEKGVKVSTEIINGLCFATDDGELSELMGNPGWADLGLKERCANTEAFINLCCSGGVYGLRQRLGKDIKIIPGMRQVGTCQLFLALDKEKEFVLIDRERSAVIQSK